MSHFSTRWRRSAIAASVAVALAVAGALLAPAAATAAAPASVGSCVRTLATGDSRVNVSFDGADYAVLVHVPAAPPRQKLPLVVDLHGSNANGSVQASISDLRTLADRERFIVVEPTGDIAFPQTLPDGNWAWNVPGVPLTSGTYPPPGSRDDVAFLRAVVAQIDASGCVDDRRVFATGFSGGGRMASALACEASDVFAAIAPVAGLRAGRADASDFTTAVPATCTPAQPVAVATFHGTADFVNPYPGNEDLRWGYSVNSAAARWAQINECRVGPQVAQYSASIRTLTWSKCSRQADVVLYEVAEGGHTWPGTSVDLSPLGATTQEISASEAMWSFFSAHQRRG
ncbi:PHB depolymerase family esterase [Microbacterium sp. SS28]|uniref:extracellular catalytic domain type 1 short-chain-length polyhydroxyalkanoate depolymerase n=1 Tax=Microbacterium sp. SS28 TaxID=2919948 RepID=UPI001FAA5429|nr:PHB depolymerase family esterase [Microbacterium sp. SS28]